MDSRAHPWRVTPHGLWLAARNLLHWSAPVLRPIGVILSIWAVFLLPEGGSLWFQLSLAVVPIATVLSMRRDRRDPVVWGLYFVGILVFGWLRATTVADVHVPVQTAYAVGVDRLMGLGITLPEGFQALIPLNVPVLTGALIIYLSFLFVPFLLTYYVWLKHRRFFTPFVLAQVIFLIASLALSTLLPTVPPWMASQMGEVAKLNRFLHDAARLAGSTAYLINAKIMGPSPVAAMPSLRLGMTVLAAMAITRINPRLRLFGWVYVLAMGFVLVFGGEEWVLCLLVGWLYAWGAYHVVEMLLGVGAVDDLTAESAEDAE